MKEGRLQEGDAGMIVCMWNRAGLCYARKLQRYPLSRCNSIEQLCVDEEICSIVISVHKEGDLLPNILLLTGIGEGF